MKKVPYIVLGIILLGAIGIVFVSRDNSNVSETNQIQITMTPSPTNNNSDKPKSASSSEEADNEILNATSAIIRTSKGTITLELYPDVAPNTVKNFIEKATSGYYENLIFHRVEDWVVQGGDPDGNGTGGGEMATELSDKPFVIGSLGVARGQDIKISNDSQFFITTKDSSFLNGQYTNFGIVTSGMDVVDQMQIGDKILSIEVK